MRRRYRSLIPGRPSAVKQHPPRPKDEFLPGFWEDEAYQFVPDLTVYDTEVTTVKTGILDAQGNPIVYEEGGMEPFMGFIKPSWVDQDEEESEPEEDDDWT